MENDNKTDTYVLTSYKRNEDSTMTIIPEYLVRLTNEQYETIVKLPSNIKDIFYVHNKEEFTFYSLDKVESKPYDDCITLLQENNFFPTKRKEICMIKNMNSLP